MRLKEEDSMMKYMFIGRMELLQMMDIYIPLHFVWK